LGSKSRFFSSLLLFSANSFHPCKFIPFLQNDPILNTPRGAATLHIMGNIYLHSAHPMGTLKLPVNY
jgi:hypothetical protein